MAVSAKRKAALKAYRDANPEKHRAAGARYRKANPEKVKAQQDAWRRDNPEKWRAYSLKAYGLTVDQYVAMLESQGGGCAICFTDVPDGKGKVFVVDHCHRTGRVRGLLCQKCNSGLGMFRDNPALLRHAATYLQGKI